MYACMHVCMYICWLVMIGLWWSMYIFNYPLAYSLMWLESCFRIWVYTLYFGYWIDTSMLLAAPGPHYTHWRSTCRCRQKHAAVAASREQHVPLCAIPREQRARHRVPQLHTSEILRHRAVRAFFVPRWWAWKWKTSCLVSSRIASVRSRRFAQLLLV